MAFHDQPANIGELPPGVRLFPLEGVVLLPGSELPLHIFEPRYRAMVVDSLASDRMIAMVQPRADNTRPHMPDLYDVGALGRIARHSETGDGRFLITLTGVIRFRLRRELQAGTPYRQAEVSYAGFEADVRGMQQLAADCRAKLEAVLRRYARQLSFSADWNAIHQAVDDVLVGALCMALPFRPVERQALLEAPDLTARADMLMTLMRLVGDGPDSGTVQ
jgi:Lon protease-like protein